MRFGGTPVDDAGRLWRRQYRRCDASGRRFGGAGAVRHAYRRRTGGLLVRGDRTGYGVDDVRVCERSDGIRAYRAGTVRVRDAAVHPCAS